MIDLVTKTHAVAWSLSGITAGKGGADASLDGICCGTDSIVGTITTLAIDLLGVVAFIILIYGSISYLTAYGDEAKAEVAKKTLLWSITGVLVTVFARVIMELVFNALKK